MKNNETPFVIDVAEIVSVGTELLVGQTLNTNSQYLANQLTLLGISSYYQSVVGDNPARLKAVLNEAVSRADLVITTGGLGPTQDDITMQIAAEVAGQELVEHPAARDALTEYFGLMGLEVSPNNWKQAWLPENAEVFINTNGTAPGAVVRFERDGQPKAIALLPGPPSEMSVMFQHSLRNWLEKHVTHQFKHRFLRMMGIGESLAETKIKDLIEQQTNPTIALYAAEGEVAIRVTQRLSRDLSEADLMEETVEQIKERVGEFIYEDGKRTLPEVLTDLLKTRDLSVSFAESCTAGMVTSELASIPGVSAVLTGSLVAYNNQIKESVLGVPGRILRDKGAVSSQCAEAMARGARKLFDTDLAVAVTGIAGPAGGTEDKPVGLVYLAVCSAERCLVEKHQLRGNRSRVRRVATLRALNLLRRFVLAEI